MARNISKYLIIFSLLLITAGFAGCHEDELLGETDAVPSGSEIEFVVGVKDFTGTRGVEDESKKLFEIGELLHIRAEFKCERNGANGSDVQYGVLKYNGKGSWVAYDNDHAMHWPDDAVSGSFQAYYIYGSNGILTENTMQPKLLSDYQYGEDPLYGECMDISYGTTVRLEMSHIFAHISLTEMSNDVPGELWFAVPESIRMSSSDPELDEPVFNNAFYLKFDEETSRMTPVFTQVEGPIKLDKNDDELFYITGNAEQYDTKEGRVMTRVHYFLEPRIYHRFTLLYARSHTEYATYLTYVRDLSNVLKEQDENEELLPNGTYEFSVLKSLGVMVEEEPDDNWDESDPVYVIDVEEFLKAAANGLDYWEDIEGSDEKIQILEKTLTGTRLLENIDFHNVFYNDIFNDGYVPNLSNTFDGNYHYIHNVGSPLFYMNQGNIINLGLKDVKIVEIESNENYPYGDGVGTFDTSYNGIISCVNAGVVRNVRVIDAEINVKIRTSDADDRTQEAHNAALLFGMNRGTVSNISLAGSLQITVINAEGETIIPNVMIGGVAGQNLGTVSGMDAITGENLRTPKINIVNLCEGTNGVYLIGGIAGLNPGTLEDIYLPAVSIKSGGSSGVESRIGGVAGEIPNSNTGAPQISGCIVRGDLEAGRVNALINVTSLSYAGGLAGSLNLQAIVVNNSISVSVAGSPYSDDRVSYATGGAFGRIEKSAATLDGEIRKLAAFGASLTGVSTYIGNFAGIVPAGYGWDFYADKEITVRQIYDDNVGIEM